MKKRTLALILLPSATFLFFIIPTKSLTAEKFQYVGNKKCIACHKNEYKSWRQNYHAKALDDLKPGVKAEAKTKANVDPAKDYSADASCLECHSTGYGRPAAKGADLGNVGCESCHGPGSKYRTMKIMNKKKYKEDPEGQHKLALEAGLIKPTDEVCIKCHNDRSPTWKGFDYCKMIEGVKHKK